MTAEEIVTELVKEDPIVSDAEEGPYCFFCMVQWGYWPHKTPAHKPDCLWQRAKNFKEGV